MDEEALKRDRERFTKAFDPYQESFNFYRVNPRRQQAYDQCAPEVVSLLKCVDAEGPTWFWRCNKYHNELQRCYEIHKQVPPAPFEAFFKNATEAAKAGWRYAKAGVEELIGGSSNSEGKG